MHSRGMLGDMQLLAYKRKSINLNNPVDFYFEAFSL